MSENRNVIIKINGKEITNDIRSVRREWRIMKNDIAGVTRGTQEYQNKAAGIRKLKGILDEHNKGLRSIKTNTTDAGKNMGVFNGVLNKGKALLSSALGPLLAITTAFALFRRAKNTIQEFNVALDELQAITGLQGEKLNFLKKEAVDTGKQVGKTGREMLEAYKLVGSAQPVLLQNEKALAGVTKRAIILSQATGNDLKQSVMDLTTVMNANNATTDETDRYLNTIAAGSKVGAKEVGFITQALKNVGPGAASAGVGIEQSVAAVELFGEKGIDAARTGTQFRNILLILQEDQKNFTDGQFDFNKAVENLGPIMNDSVALTKQFGRENVVGAQILAQNKDRLDELTQAVTGTNTAYEQAAINTDNSAAAQARFEASLDAIILKFSEGDGLIAAFYDAAAFYLDFLGSEIDEFKELFGGLFEEFSGLLEALGLVNSETETLDVIMKILKTSINATFTPLKLLIQGIKNGFALARAAVDFFIVPIKAIPDVFAFALNKVKAQANTLIDQIKGLTGIEVASKFEIKEVDLPDFRASAAQAKSALLEIAEDNKDFGAGLRDDFVGIWSDDNAKKAVSDASEDIAGIALDSAKKIIDNQSGGSGGSGGASDEDIEKQVRDAQEKIFNAISKVTGSREENEILAVEQQFNGLLDLADKYGLDRAEIEEARNQKLKEINDQYRQAEDQANQDANEKELAAEKKLAADKQAIKEAQIKLSEQILGDAIDLVSQGIENEEAKELESLERKKEQGLIAEEEFERQKLAIQQAAFKKKKAVDIAQAIINGALAITKATAQTGVGAPFVIPTIIASTAGQVATIAAQKFKDGGVLNGPSHADRGMPIINPKTGRVDMEVEGGEFVVRKRSVNAKTLPILRSINSGNGRLPRVNFPTIERSLSRYQDGGVLGAGSESAAPGFDDSKFISQLAGALGGAVASAVNDKEIFIKQKTIEDAESRKARAQTAADIRA